MLTDCDTCKYLDDCEKDPQMQLRRCWRYRHFLDDPTEAITRLDATLKEVEEFAGEESREPKAAGISDHAG